MRLLVALSLLCVLPAGPVWAHAQLRASEPAAGAVLPASPSVVRLRFSEPVELKFSRLTLYDAEGRVLAERVPERADADGQRLTAVLPALARGSYALAWQVVSAIDGHVTRGAIPFALGTASATAPSAQPQARSTLSPPWGRVLLRWLAFAGLFLWLGAAGFAHGVMRPTDPLRDATARRLWRLLQLGAALALVGELGDFLHQAVAVGGFSTVGALLGVRYGHLAVLRLGAAALALALSARRRGWVACGGLAAVFALARALSGHAAALASGAAWAVTADALHLIALGLWLGGLVAILWLGPTVRAGTPQQRLAAWGTWLPRFSSLALAAVIVTFTSGLILAWAHLPSWSALWTSAYGRALLAKHALLVPLLALAALNRSRHVPALQQPGTSGGTLTRLRRTVAGESALAGGILVAGAWLTLVAPPVPAPEPFVIERTVTYLEAPVRVRLVLTPRAVGPSRVEVALADAQGEPLESQRVRLTLQDEAGALGPTRLTLTEEGSGRYAFEGTLFSWPGTWNVTVQARFRGQAQDLEVQFTLEVPGA